MIVNRYIICVTWLIFIYIACMLAIVSLVIIKKMCCDICTDLNSRYSFENKCTVLAVF